MSSRFEAETAKHLTATFGVQIRKRHVVTCPDRLWSVNLTPGQTRRVASHAVRIAD